jgi:hypothetical protein
VTERERFRRLMHGEPVDRPPLLEEGVRDEVLERWHDEGLPRGSTHVELFGLTPHENVGPDITYAPQYFGHVFALSAREYGRAFDVSRRRFPRDWDATVERLARRDHVVCIWASRGFFQALGVGDWPTFEQVLVGTRKQRGRIRERLEQYGEFCARMLELTLRDVDPEFIYLSEPISDNGGPLISPAMFEELMIPVYRRIVATAREHGCEHVLVSTYGNSAGLFPALLDAGVTLLWISEAPELPELDYRTLRCRFGPTLGLIGGIPLGILRDGSPDQIVTRLREIVPPLLASGRYIPLAAGRVRAGVSWAAYKRYREVLGEILGAAGRTIEPKQA